jgi:hypothetical protein
LRGSLIAPIREGITIKGLAIYASFPSYLLLEKGCLIAAAGRAETIRPRRGLFLRHHLSYWQGGNPSEFGGGCETRFYDDGKGKGRLWIK